MPSTHTSLHVHIVFSTKDRQPWFDAEFLPELHAYLGGMIKGMGGHSHVNGGIADHVHVLTGLTANHRLSDIMRELKADSSKWIKSKLNRSAFEWQKGYGAFTVSPPDIEKVRRYIANQAEHHRQKTFQEEYVEMLKRGMVEYDERYLW